ncbi:glycosyltransferase [Saccharopolyspora gregorii]|uniref:Glycosyltransferase n=1 Tax=Saccharopolyspora gregorii TaxID=33914 RepID=A0ABP6S1Z6_9PSEU|nr:glycosyltransferase [Saccharopolyspora gregorii]
MRIVFSSLSGHGHLYPLIPLARAARAHGHDVLFATGDPFRGTIEELGLRFAAVGVPIGAGFAAASGGSSTRPEPGSAEWLRLVSLVFGAELPRRYLADLRPVLAEFKPDLVVHEAGNHGAGLAAREAGIPGVCHGFGRQSPANYAGFDPALRSVAADAGIELPEGDLRTLGNPFLDIFPASLQPAEFLESVARFPLRPVPFAPSGALPPEAVAERSRPLVYLTLGTGFGDAAVLRSAVDGLAALEVDVLVAAGPSVQAGALGELPPNVSVHEWVPQAELLEHVDLVVHHGGSGTTLAALGAGLPQLFLPQGADQFGNAETITTAGGGEQLLGAEVTAESVRTAAAALLGDSPHRRVARRVAAEIAEMPSPERVAERLPDFAR